MTRTSKQKQTEYLRAWRESGLNAAEYCRQNGIKSSSFYGWIKQEKKTSRVQKFVKVSSSSGFKHSGNIKLRKDGWEIDIPVGTDEKELIRVFSALGLSHVS
jgi:transposase-like protein